MNVVFLMEEKKRRSFEVTKPDLSVEINGMQREQLSLLRRIEEKKRKLNQLSHEQEHVAKEVAELKQLEEIEKEFEKQLQLKVMLPFRTHSSEKQTFRSLQKTQGEAKGS